MIRRAAATWAVWRTLSPNRPPHPAPARHDRARYNRAGLIRPETNFPGPNRRSPTDPTQPAWPNGPNLAQPTELNRRNSTGSAQRTQPDLIGLAQPTQPDLTGPARTNRPGPDQPARPGCIWPGRAVAVDGCCVVVL
ncbi:hypothetical protein GCM10022222_53560 [Amycolatopsis ultiminotia]|uniref:Uncharacterized protein n=1 Tax=Amycolatopsis ultiminotia TaxID=543629 RepID=A0ABP6X8G7_9PSEU